MAEEGSVTTATLKVGGMSCSHCVGAVTKALQGVDGVKGAQVDLAGHKAIVEYDPQRTTPRALANVIMDEGYTAEEMG